MYHQKLSIIDKELFRILDSGKSIASLNTLDDVVSVLDQQKGICFHIILVRTYADQFTAKLLKDGGIFYYLVKPLFSKISSLTYCCVVLLSLVKVLTKQKIGGLDSLFCPNALLLSELVFFFLLY